MHLKPTLFVLAALLAFETQAFADESLADQAIAILDENCSSCHDGQSHSLDVLDFDVLTAERQANRDRFILPGDPANSYLWKLIKTDVMPKDSDPLSDADKETLKQWISEGANFPDFGGGERKFIPESEVLGAIEKHLAAAKVEDREFIRYFSLHVLANNRQLTDDKLRLASAALAKAVNSLSRKRSLIEIEPIDEHQTVYAVNIRDLGWDEDGYDQWQTLLAAYPYGSKPVRGDTQRTFSNIKELFEIRGFFDGFAYIRADWFIAEAMRPPLYHELLGIPDTVADFEIEEGFDRDDDFQRNQIVRGGVLLSNVSSQPRIVDYHEAERGVWMSFDFLSQPVNDPERGDIVRFPLGPIFEGNPHQSAAFEHAGGEIIFTLPNGLHGYMLVDDKGVRIDAGPVEIVADPSMLSGTPEIVNGLSCISCHRHGMIDFTDQIAEGHAMTDQVDIAKIEAIYRPTELQQRMEEERAAYLRTLRKVIGPFLQKGEDESKSIESFPEPITTVARLYKRDLDAEQVASELGLADTGFLNQTIQNQTELISLGLGVLPRGGAIKRSHWEARGRSARESIFQRASRKFGFTPVTRL